MTATDRDRATEQYPHTRLGWIYRLRDPRDGAIRYIGKTERPLTQRLRGHLDARCEKRHLDTPVYIWLRELRPLKPWIEPVAIVRLVDEPSPCNPLRLSELVIMEQHWAAGHDLLNVREIEGIISNAWRAYAQDADVRGPRSLPVVPLPDRRSGGPPMPLGSWGRRQVRQAIWVYALYGLIERYPHVAIRASVYTDIELAGGARRARSCGRRVPEWVLHARRPLGHIPDPAYRIENIARLTAKQRAVIAASREKAMRY